MKIELICKECNGEEFVNRSSSYRIGGDWKQTQCFECKKCKTNIEIIYYTKIKGEGDDWVIMGEHGDDGE